MCVVKYEVLYHLFMLQVATLNILVLQAILMTLQTFAHKNNVLFFSTYLKIVCEHESICEEK